VSKQAKLGIWIISAMKVLALFYITFNAQLPLFAQLVLLPFLLLESLALAGVVLEMPTSVETKRQQGELSLLQSHVGLADNLEIDKVA